MALYIGPNKTVGLAAWDINAPYTLMGRFRPWTTNGGYLYLAGRTNDDEGHDGLWLNNSSMRLTVETKVPPGSYVAANEIAVTLSAGTWYKWAYVRQSTSAAFGWLDGTTADGSGSLNSRQAAQYWQLGDAFPGSALNVESLMLLDVALTAAQLAQVQFVPPRGRVFGGAM
jgi:hypothetical protein